jgi:hypothetical protein
MRSLGPFGLAVLLVSVVGCAGSHPETRPLDPPESTSEQQRRNLEIIARNLEADRRQSETRPSPASDLVRTEIKKMADVDTAITGVDEDMNIVLVAAGSDDGLRVGYFMIVYRGNEYVGRLVIDKVGPDWSSDHMVLDMTESAPRKGDRATTQL